MFAFLLRLYPLYFFLPCQTWAHWVVETSASTMTQIPVETPVLHKPKNSRPYSFLGVFSESAHPPSDSLPKHAFGLLGFQSRKTYYRCVRSGSLCVCAAIVPKSTVKCRINKNNETTIVVLTIVFRIPSVFNLLAAFSDSVVRSHGTAYFKCCRFSHINNAENDVNNEIHDNKRKVGMRASAKYILMYQVVL